MKIDRKLNLVLPIIDGVTKDEKGVEHDSIVAYVHATPISKEVFEKYFLVLSKVHARILSEGLGWAAGPRVAALMLEKIAKEDGIWEGEDGVSRGLLGEIVRLSNVFMPMAAGGWDMIPLQLAIGQNLLSPDDIGEVKSIIVFFTVASWLYPKAVRDKILTEAVALSGGRTESSSCTEFSASLPTSIATGSTGGSPAASFLPS